MKSPPANRLDSSEQQQKMRQTQFLLTGVAENTPKPASHSERSPGGRAWETPGTEASSHQSYYYSFYRPQERHVKKYELIFLPSVYEIKSSAFLSALWENGLSVYHAPHQG